MDTIERDGLKLTWLHGGVVHFDGGAMFGVVPKPLWSRKYPTNELNQVEIATDPILIQKDGYNILVDAGIGNGRFTEKQKRNYGVTNESTVEEDLAKLNLTTADIDIVLMTHLHFDHVMGLIKEKEGQEVPTFENALIYVSDIEWSEMKAPNIRSQNTYWERNWQPIKDQVRTFNNQIEIIPGISLIHTGGHSDGHSLLLIEHNGATYIHFADILPTHAHANVLWVMAYDDFPIDSIAAKQKWKEIAIKRDAWCLFYHDYKYRAIKWNEQGEITDFIERKQL